MIYDDGTESMVFLEEIETIETIETIQIKWESIPLSFDGNDHFILGR